MLNESANLSSFLCCLLVHSIAKACGSEHEITVSQDPAQCRIGADSAAREYFAEIRDSSATSELRPTRQLPESLQQKTNSHTACVHLVERRLLRNTSFLELHVPKWALTKTVTEFGHPKLCSTERAMIFEENASCICWNVFTLTDWTGFRLSVSPRPSYRYTLTMDWFQGCARSLAQ